MMNTTPNLAGSAMMPPANSMMAGGQPQQPPSTVLPALPPKPRPEDAASHITVSMIVSLSFVESYWSHFRETKNLDKLWAHSLLDVSRIDRNFAL